VTHLEPHTPDRVPGNSIIEIGCTAVSSLYEVAIYSVARSLWRSARQGTGNTKEGTYDDINATSPAGISGHYRTH
jgi:hypothetical protein